MVYLAIINNAVVFQGSSIADCIAFFNSSATLQSLKQNDVLAIAEIKRTATVSVQIVVSP